MRVVELEEKRTQFSLSPFAAPIGEQMTPNAYLSAPVTTAES